MSLSGVVGFDFLASDVREFLAARKGRAAFVELSSPGGMVDAGLEIYNLFADHGNVTLRCVGFCMSAASYAAMAAKRFEVAPNSVFMLHNPWSFMVGDHADMEREAKLLDDLARVLAQAYAVKSRITEQEARALMARETYLVGGQTIVDAGFADAVAVVGASDSGDSGDEGEARAALRAMASRMKSAPAASRGFDPQKIAALLRPRADRANMKLKQASAEASAEEQPGAQTAEPAVDAPKAAPGPGVSHAELDAALQKFAEDINAAMATKADGEGSPGMLSIDISAAVLDGSESDADPSTDDAAPGEGGEETAQAPAAPAAALASERKRVSALFAYLDADPQNETLRGLVIRAVRSGQSLASVRPQLDVAIRNGGAQRASGENPPNVATEPLAVIRQDPEAERIAEALGVTPEQMAAALERRQKARR